ncbi:MAG: hypothetical protein EAZ44_10960 [Cytophagia bacterium]|nr:MAG: hypothetical protein EAZ44_10960 [Cytophagia bacterium]TAG40873.1 MAG: hypothetical protein EAZ31_08030 [Cytophagia bacterium]
MKKNIFVFILLGSILLAACNKKNDEPTANPTLQTQTVSNLAADPTTNTGTGQPQPATGKFTLYSLANKAIVPNTDSTTNKWDIGFRGTTIIVNGGTIRTGQGGAYIFTGLFDELTTIPANQVFNTDQSTTQLAIATGSGMGWYNYNPAQNWISPIAGKILVIRTGDGKFAKVEILNYYRDSPSSPSPSAISRYYSFRYVYQPNGSLSF